MSSLETIEALTKHIKAHSLTLVVKHNAWANWVAWSFEKLDTHKGDR